MKKTILTILVVISYSMSVNAAEEWSYTYLAENGVLVYVAGFNTLEACEISRALHFNATECQPVVTELYTGRDVGFQPLDASTIVTFGGEDDGPVVVVDIKVIEAFFENCLRGPQPSPNPGCPRGY